MQRLRRFLVEPASTQLGCAQLQRRVNKLGIAEAVTKRKERRIRFVHIARMIFFVVVAGWTAEINAVRRTPGVQCVIVEWFLPHAVGHGNGELPTRTQIAKKCSHQRRSCLHSWKPGLQNRRYVTRGPSDAQWPAAENNQHHAFPRSGNGLQKLLLVSWQTEMGAGSSLGTHPEGVFSQR